MQETGTALGLATYIYTIVFLIAEVIKTIINLRTDTPQREGLVLQADTTDAIEHCATVVNAAVEHVACTARQRESKARYVSIGSGTRRSKIGIAILDTNGQCVTAIEQIVFYFLVR